MSAGQHRYRAFPPVDLPDRRWPGNVISRAPAWLSTDLRDGNQALFEPMGPERKLRMFRHALRDRFPGDRGGLSRPRHRRNSTSSATLIGQGHIPPDVTIGVLTAAREPLIRRTVESLRGATAGHRPRLQRHLARVPGNRVRHEPRGGRGHGRRERAAHSRALRRAAGNRVGARVQPGELLRHGTRVLPGRYAMPWPRPGAPRRSAR